MTNTWNASSNNELWRVQALRGGRGNTLRECKSGKEENYGKGNGERGKGWRQFRQKQSEYNRVRRETDSARTARNALSGTWWYISAAVGSSRPVRGCKARSHNSLPRGRKKEQVPDNTTANGRALTRKSTHAAPPSHAFGRKNRQIKKRNRKEERKEKGERAVMSRAFFAYYFFGGRCTVFRGVRAAQFSRNCFFFRATKAKLSLEGKKGE